jgi:hypothetical protein
MSNADPPSWTIRGVAPEKRQAAIDAASRKNVAMGVWITEAIDHRIRSDRASDGGLTGEVVPRPSDIVSSPSDAVSDREEHAMAVLQGLAEVLERVSATRGSGALATALRRVMAARLAALEPPQGPPRLALEGPEEKR